MCFSSFWVPLYLAFNENLSPIWYLIGKKNILRQPNFWRFSIDQPFTEHVKGISESKGRQTCDELKVEFLISVNVIEMPHISRSMVKRLVNKVFTFDDLNSFNSFLLLRRSRRKFGKIFKNSDQNIGFFKNLFLRYFWR